MMDFLLFITGVLASLNLNITEMALNGRMQRRRRERATFCGRPDRPHSSIAAIPNMTKRNYLHSKKDGSRQGLVGAFFGVTSC